VPQGALPVDGMEDLERSPGRPGVRPDPGGGAAAPPPRTTPLRPRRNAAPGAFDTADLPAGPIEGLRAVAFFVAWPGLVGVSAFVLYRAARFQRDVRHDPVGRLVLLMVVGSIMTWAAVAAFATIDLAEREGDALVLPLFLLWAGSMVLFTWIMHRWGAEAVRLNRYHAELAQMDRMKAQLINTVAHEINTPLTPIRFRVASLKSGGLGPVQPRQLEAFESIERNLDRVDTLVAKMALAVQLQQGRIQLRLAPVPLAELAAEVAGRLLPAANAKGVRLEVDAAGAAAVEADRKRLGLALEALLSNAVKFTPAGGLVRVRGVRDGTDVGLEVADSGIGLTADAQAALFQPLRQEHKAMLTDAGPGLGLYIAQGLVRLHGGRITVASDGEGKGATFRLLLPAT
jgi:signal transduction histidine kinase